MGQKQTNQNKSNELDKIEQMLYDTYKNTDIDFTFKEILTIKLRVADAEKYFQSPYNYLLYFNSYIFHERLSTLYDNFSVIVEKFSRNNPNEVFKMLIDFDEEVDIQSYEESNVPNKIDYESLFTIIFEPLEIDTILFFLMTNQNKYTLPDFFSQLFENIYLYKTTRKFDTLYFLLPNLDMFIRNETYTLYIVNQPDIFDERLDMLSDYSIKFENEVSQSIFESLYFKQLLKIQYKKSSKANSYLMGFIHKMIPSPVFIKTVIKIDLYYPDINDFLYKYDTEFKLMEYIFSNSNVNMLLVYLNKDKNNPNYSIPYVDYDSGSSTTRNNHIGLRSFTSSYSMTYRNSSNNKSKMHNLIFNNGCKYNNLEFMIKKLANYLDKSKFNKSYFIVKFIDTRLQKEIDKNEINIVKDKINNIMQSLIDDSFTFSKRDRIKKIIIEYIVAYPLTEDGQVNLNISSENINNKIKEEYKYFLTKIYYCWFLNDKYINKLKRKIFNLLIDKIKDKKSFDIIFQYLFDDKYYLHTTSYRSGKITLDNLEKMFFI